MWQNQKKFLIVCFFVVISVLITLFVCYFFYSYSNKNHFEVKSSEMIGIGGYGTIFDAKISPFDSDCFGCISDMGGAYFSYDHGKIFSRQNILGTLYDLQFDNSNESVVWLAGSGDLNLQIMAKLLKWFFHRNKIYHMVIAIMKI